MTYTPGFKEGTPPFCLGELHLFFKTVTVSESTHIPYAVDCTSDNTTSKLYYKHVSGFPRFLDFVNIKDLVLVVVSRC